MATVEVVVSNMEGSVVAVFMAVVSEVVASTAVASGAPVSIPEVSEVEVLHAAELDDGEDATGTIGAITDFLVMASL